MATHAGSSKPELPCSFSLLSFLLPPAACFWRCVCKSFRDFLVSGLCPLFTPQTPVPNPETLDRWRADIKSHGHTFSLGVHDTPELAAQAYDAALLRLRGERQTLNPGALMSAPNSAPRGAGPNLKDARQSQHT